MNRLERITARELFRLIKGQNHRNSAVKRATYGLVGGANLVAGYYKKYIDGGAIFPDAQMHLDIAKLYLSMAVKGEIKK